MLSSSLKIANGKNENLVNSVWKGFSVGGKKRRWKSERGGDLVKDTRKEPEDIFEKIEETKLEENVNSPSPEGKGWSRKRRGGLNVVRDFQKKKEKKGDKSVILPSPSLNLPMG